MKRAYNEMKLGALAVFEANSWLSPPEWAALARYYPVRAAYTYLKRLWSWKLLERQVDRRGLLLYQISERGRARLRWLRKNRELVAGGKLSQAVELKR